MWGEPLNLSNHELKMRKRDWAIYVACFLFVAVIAAIAVATKP